MQIYESTWSQMNYVYWMLTSLIFSSIQAFKKEQIIKAIKEIQ
jgi:hypothetical protein